MNGEMTRLSVHLASKNRMHVCEDKRQPFRRSKRSVVRIHSGVPAQALPESTPSISRYALKFHPQLLLEPLGIGFRSIISAAVMQVGGLVFRQGSR